MAVNNGKRLGESHESHVDSQTKTPSIVAHAKQAILALVVSTGLAGTAMADENKPVEGIQVADASGQIVLANYSESGLSQEDIQAVMAGKNEVVMGLLASGRFQKGRYLKMSDEKIQQVAERMAGDFIIAFLEGKDELGVVESVALSSVIVSYVSLNGHKFALSVPLSDEAQIARDKAQIARDKAQIARDKAQIAKLKKLGENIEDINAQSTN